MSDQIIIQCTILEKKKVCERMIFFSKLTLYLAAAVRRRKCQISELEKSYLMMTWQRCKAEIHGGDRFQMLLQSRKVELFWCYDEYLFSVICLGSICTSPTWEPASQSLSVCVYIVSINDFSTSFLGFFCHISRLSMYCVCVRCHPINIQSPHTRAEFTRLTYRYLSTLQTTHP